MKNRNLQSVPNFMLEIVCRLVLWILFICAQDLKPFVRHIEEEELWMYRYPVVPSYLQMRYLWHVIILIPVVVFTVEFMVFYDDVKKVDQLKNDIAGCTLAYPTNGIFTYVLKNIIGRPRPNFFYKCFPDGLGTNLMHCTGDPNIYTDARRSFPSGHSSFVFCSMWFLTLNLLRELDLQKSVNLKTIKMVICALPICFATVVAISRTCDYNHHYSDTLGGAVLGMFVASFTYWMHRNTTEIPVCRSFIVNKI